MTMAAARNEHGAAARVQPRGATRLGARRPPSCKRYALCARAHNTPPAEQPAGARGADLERGGARGAPAGAGTSELQCPQPPSSPASCLHASPVTPRAAARRHARGRRGPARAHTVTRSIPTREHLPTQPTARFARPPRHPFPRRARASPPLTRPRAPRARPRRHLRARHRHCSPRCKTRPCPSPWPERRAAASLHACCHESRLRAAFDQPRLGVGFWIAKARCGAEPRVPDRSWLFGSRGPSIGAARPAAHRCSEQSGAFVWTPYLGPLRLRHPGPAHAVPLLVPHKPRNPARYARPKPFETCTHMPAGCWARPPPPLAAPRGRPIAPARARDSKLGRARWSLRVAAACAWLAARFGRTGCNNACTHTTKAAVVSTPGLRANGKVHARLDCSGDVVLPIP